jgi:peptidoglycan hydrolase-like protein with peptidoglycan-binding domain
MASMMTFNHKGIEKGAQFFVIDHSVGRAGRNRVDDVQLVQFLINRAIDIREEEIKANQTNELITPELKNRRFVDRNGRPLAKLVVDGKCGPKTVQAIFAFQNFYGQLSPVADGTISAVSDPNRIEYVGGANAKAPRGYYLKNTMYVLSVMAQGGAPHSPVFPILAEVKVQPLRAALAKAVLEYVSQRL